MNNYARLPHVRNELNANGTTSNDDDILRAIARASEFARSLTQRIFHTETATAYFDGNGKTRLWLGASAVEPNRGDLLTVTSIAVDDNGDGTYEYTLVEGTDYWLYPDSSTIAAVRIDLIVDHQTAPQVSRWAPYRRSVKIVGKWGHSETTDAVIISGAQITGTLSSASDLTLAVSASITRDEIAPGDTLIIESEQVEVLSVSTTTVTLQTRGLNGTTAAAHTDAAIYLRRFPADLERAVAKDAARYLWNAASGMSGLGGDGRFREAYPAIRDAIEAYRMPRVA